jgi:crossover junction endodeoxyribonuclease RuvC
MKRVLGLDPGLLITGYGCVALADGEVEPQLIEAGVLRFSGKLPMIQRLKQLHDDVARLIDELKPEEVAVEKLYAHYKHPRTAILMAHARGVMLLAAEQADLPVADLPATEVKKSITGNGHATKRQMQLAVQAQCSLEQPPHPPDVADAIAIALCHARRLAIDRL